MSEFDKKLDGFVNAACELLHAWEMEDHTGDYYAEGYPFEKAFGEVIDDILAWRDRQRPSYQWCKWPNGRIAAQHNIGADGVCTDCGAKRCAECNVIYRNQAEHAEMAGQCSRSRDE